jgi:hypothetical protein
MNERQRQLYKAVVTRSDDPDQQRELTDVYARTVAASEKDVQVVKKRLRELAGRVKECAG